MAWNDLADNRAVSPANLQGSPISRRDGQPHSGDQRALTRSQANQQLMIQILPNDNKLVTKQELNPLTLYLAGGSWGYSTDPNIDPCNMPMDGVGSLYSSESNGIITPYSYIASFDGTNYHELDVVGKIAWFQSGQRKWADVEVAQIIGNINSCATGKPTVYIGVMSVSGRNMRVGASRPLTSYQDIQVSVAYFGSNDVLNTYMDNGSINRDFTLAQNLNSNGSFSVTVLGAAEDANYKYVGVGGIGQVPVDEIS